MIKIAGYDVVECPFCSGKELMIDEGGGWHWIDCSCGCEGPSDLGVSGAIEAWNNQPQRALAEHQRIVIEHLFNVIEAAGLMLDEAYKQAQSVSTQTGSSEK